MIIKVDVDGVIRNINDVLCRLYNELFDEDLTADNIFDYNVEKVFKKIKTCIGISAVDYFFKISSKEVFLKSKPYEGIQGALKRLMDAGHKVVIVTWQFNYENKQNTLNFLKKNKIPYDDICFTKDKWMIHGDWLIDDNPAFLNDKREKSSKIIIDMPYNKNYNSCPRVNNLVEAVNMIMENRNEKCSQV